MTNYQQVFTSAYDCTLRETSFVSNMSREVFAMENTLICSFDISSSGNEIWISDAEGGLSHVDPREEKSKVLRWELSGSKIGCVSVNPTNPEMLLVASNDRTLKYVESSLQINLSITFIEYGMLESWGTSHWINQ